MKNSKFFLIFATIFLILSYYVAKDNERPVVVISKQDSSLNLNSTLTQYFHMGFKRLISSTMWIATILESDLDHYKNKDLNSWMFLRFKTIADLEPRFYENYSLGAVYLSIVKDDLVGASYMYDKGLIQYPNDYHLLKNAGFHYEFEVGDSKRAFEIYNVLKVHPQIDFVTLGIAARLESQLGDKDTAYQLLLDQYKKLPDYQNHVAVLLAKNIYALKAEIDLDCLNNKKENCSKMDFDNNYYLFDGKKYYAQKEWVPFKMKKRKK